MKTSFTRFAGICAILDGLAGFCYAVAFLIIVRSAPDVGVLLSGLFLLLSGLLSSAVFVSLYHKLMTTEGGYALWAMLMGVVSAAGAAIHGGYDLANAINPPANLTADLPSQIDPRGLLTFGFASIAIYMIARLMGHTPSFPTGLSRLGYVLALLLAVLYLGRLVLLDPTNPVIVTAAVLNGFFVNPAWYIWLGLTLRRQEGEG